MAVDFAHPVLSDLYSSGTGTDWPGYLQDNIAAAAMWLDGLDPPGKRVGFKRLNAGVFQQWNGTAWVALPVTFGAATLGDPLTITAATVNVPNNALTFKAATGPILAVWQAPSAGPTDSATLRIQSNDVGGLWTAYHSAHGTRPNSVWLMSNDANAAMVIGQANAERIRLVPSGPVLVTGNFEAFSNNTNRLRVSGSSGALYLDSLNAAGSAWLPQINRASSHTWHLNSSPNMFLGVDGGLSLSPTGASYSGARLTVIPITNPPSDDWMNIKQVCIGEQSSNVDYRLQLGFATTGGVWIGAIQAVAGANPTSLYLNGAGGSVAIGTPSGGAGDLYLQRYSVSGGRRIMFPNVGANASHNNTYEIGGIYAQGFRDIYGAAYVAGISFQRSPTSGGLSSAGDIVFSASSAGTSTAENMELPRMRIRGADGCVLIARQSSSNIRFALDIGDGSATTGLRVNLNDQFAIAVAMGAGANYYIGAANALSTPAMQFSNSAAAARFFMHDDGRFEIIAGSGKLWMAGGITRFESGEFNCPTGGALWSAATGGPRTPDLVQWVLRCKAVEGGYSVGDEIVILSVDQSDTSRMWTFWNSGATIKIMFIGPGVPIARTTTGTPFALTPANWRVVGRAHWL